MAMIEAELSDKVLLEIDLDEVITFIGGKSGTGKTLIIDSLKAWISNPALAKLNGINISGIEPDQIIICKNFEEVPYKIKDNDLESKLIIIDRYDYYPKEYKAMIWKAMSTLKGIYIIMSRFPDIPKNYGFSRDSFKEIKESKIIKDGKEKILLSI